MGTSKFLRVRCGKCKHEQIIFERATTSLKCLSCNEFIGKPSGGKIIIDGGIVEYLSE